MLLGCSHHHTPVAEIVLRIPRTALMEPCVARDLGEDRLPVLAPLHALISVQQTFPHATAMAPPCAHPTPKAARARSHRLTGPRARENARVSFAEPHLWNIQAHLCERPFGPALAARRIFAETRPVLGPTGSSSCCGEVAHARKIA